MSDVTITDNRTLVDVTITEGESAPIEVSIIYAAGGSSGGGSTTVIDNLTSTSATSALSANQGRVLNEGKASVASVTTVQNNLTTHENDDANPHGVTKTQVGLGNVENTALSTWTGNTSITSVGTITVGTWQGTAIADTYIASAATWNAKPSSDSTGVTGADAITNIISLTQAEYDAIGSPDATTLYVIV